MIRYLLKVGVALSGAILTACGGGSSSSGSVSEVTLGGSFSKGLYRYADVQAYEVVNGVQVPVGSKTTTDINGEYTLSLTPTSNPIVVEMTTTAATRMLDETAGFAVSTPKVGTKIRTMVSELTTSMPAVHGNVFTEMAVDGAKNATGGLTPASIAASKALVQSATGVDPFTIKPIGSTTATMDSSQEKLMTLLTAMMIEAKAVAASGGGTGCPGDSTGVSCLVTTLNAKAAITNNAGAGTYAVTDAAGLNTYLTAKTTALTNYSIPVGSDPDGFLGKMKSKSAVVAGGMSVPVAISATEAANRQGLDSFLQAMRSGFNEAESAIKARAETAKLRLDQFVFQHVGDGLKILGDAMNACTNTAGTLDCATGGNSIFTAASTGYSFSYYVDSNGLAVASNAANAYRFAGTVVAAADSSAGTGSATIVATKTLASKKISEINVNFSGAGIKQNSLSGSVSLNTMTIKAYDQAVSSSKWAQVSLSGASLAATRSSVGGLGTLTLVAPLTFSSSDGDLISGKINSLVAKERVTDTPTVGDKKAYPISVDLSLDVAVKEGALLGLGVVASQNIDVYNPDLPSTSSNQDNGNLLFTFKLADNVVIALTGSKTTYDKTNIGVKITSNGNWINLAGKTKRTDLAVNDESMDGDLVVTSSGIYTASLRKSNGEIQGEIFKGSTQIGEVVNGIVKAGGVEISLR